MLALVFKVVDLETQGVRFKRALEEYPSPVVRGE